MRERVHAGLAREARHNCSGSTKQQQHMMSVPASATMPCTSTFTPSAPQPARREHIYFAPFVRTVRTL